MTSFDGGLREPFIVRWPNHVPAGRVATSWSPPWILVPTFARVAGAEVRTIESSMAAISGRCSPGNPAPNHRTRLSFTTGASSSKAFAAANGSFTSVTNTTGPTRPAAGGKPGKIVRRHIGLELFDLENDISETNNVAEKYPTVVQRLQALGENCRDDLGDSARKRVGKNVRPASKVVIK